MRYSVISVSHIVHLEKVPDYERIKSKKSNAIENNIELTYNQNKINNKMRATNAQLK